ncbi:AAA family ATPase [Rhodococcus sp. WMMA185]|uniref:bifunctional aminoglycoside phosphotransferase/ATP-binding protein n=1 Tax=Rhodococcus sp. WMMA185 TaxID=679318 RepID=UPI00087862D6|nr:bifunctional aminoglycoside phosphotransferase/ATP-binding protein [Rhodococcus sp. WMMA185]AOW92655.1 AAA family ATPase [Rhodococcus sp. WMMA185]
MQISDRSQRSSSPRVAGDLGVNGTETHTAYVFMVGDVVFKAKKPIRTAFVDFGTAEKRREACEREVALNQRLCPDVYLGVAQLIDPGGVEAEPLVKMRRMPADRRLALLVTKDSDSHPFLDTIAELVAHFHARAERSAEIDRDATADAITVRWGANVSEVSGYQCDVLSEVEIDEVDRRARRYLRGRKDLFDNRIRESRVVDGHGDLLADDIFCLPDGPRVLDCLDFDEHLRHVDGVDDAACLAMDLEYLGREDLASRFLDRYCLEAADQPPDSLRHHYIAYRAFVRAKVACLRYMQGSLAASEDARLHCRLALRHLRVGTVRLALVGGLPGTGKSTLARGLSERTGAVVISSDRVRKELAGLDASSRQVSEFGEGLYTGTMTDRTYAEMLRRAATHLAAGQSVILDASWTLSGFRQHADLVASRSHSDLVELRCTAPRDVAIGRIRNRPLGDSDATPAVYDAMSAQAAPWTSATEVDTAAAPEESLAAAERIWHSTSEWRKD